MQTRRRAVANRRDRRECLTAVAARGENLTQEILSQELNFSIWREKLSRDRAMAVRFNKDSASVFSWQILF